jgi:nitroreductase
MVRNFTGEPPPDAALDRVLDAARRAPSAGNTAALDLLVLQGPEETARYWSVTLPDPAGFRWQGLLRAPVLVIPVVRPDAYPERYGEADKAPTGLGRLDAWTLPYWWVDGGMAVQALLLAAVAEGLGACFFGQFAHEEAVLAAFGVPGGHRALGTVALGPPAPDEPGRSAARPRRPLDEVVHRGGW